jgi:chitin synthase
LGLCLLLGISSLLAIFWLESSASILCPSVIGAIAWKDVAQQSLVVVNGKVVDPSRSPSKLGKLLQTYAGKEISNLFPAYTMLGHTTLNSSTFSDGEMQACFEDNKVANYWVFKRILEDQQASLNITANGHLVGCSESQNSLNNSQACYYSFETRRLLRSMIVGDLLLEEKSLQKKFKEFTKPNYVIIFSKVYDISSYLRHAVVFQTPNWEFSTFNNVSLTVRPSSMMFPKELTVAMARGVGQDISDAFTQPSALKYLRCIDKLFYAGRVTPEAYRAICAFGNPLLLVLTGCIYSVVIIKFMVSLLFAFGRKAEAMDSYVTCFVPCYTEGYSMRVTLETLATSDYDDRKKLLVIVCDGNIKGKGNPAPTPQLVLEMLDWKGEEPDPKLYHALGKGSDKINMAKLYCGWFRFEAHSIPYIVIAKVGKPDEVSKPKPGNRGKRDSQLILMNFFNKLSDQKRKLSPFEYEMYYQVKYFLGIDPMLYEYCLMVDADTEVRPDSLNELVASMVTDPRKIAVCGESKDPSFWVICSMHFKTNAREYL